MWMGGCEVTSAKWRRQAAERPTFKYVLEMSNNLLQGGEFGKWTKTRKDTPPQLLVQVVGFMLMEGKCRWKLDGGRREFTLKLMVVEVP